MTRWGTYYGKRYKQWIAEAENLLEEYAATPIENPVQVTVLFAIPRSRTGKLETPVGDGDNYEKALFDMLQKKGYLKDDRQITTCTWRKRFVSHGFDGYSEITIKEESDDIEIQS